MLVDPCRTDNSNLYFSLFQKLNVCLNLTEIKHLKNYIVWRRKWWYYYTGATGIIN